MTVTRSKIEWTDSTWNPTTGCTQISDGCDHCYAKTLTERFHGPGSFDKIQMHPDRLDAPLRWRKPRKVFVNSMSDLFHKDVPDEYIARVWAVMAATPQHTYQVLTKRHSRMRSLLNSDAFRERAFLSSNLDTGELHGDDWPVRNVWLGVSVEDQRTADLRIPALYETPAAVRFLSCEPLLAPVDLRPYLSHQCDCIGDYHSRLSEYGPRADWVIAGGESGRGARPMHPDWARQLRDQCQAAGVPFFFKQWGEWAPWMSHPEGEDGPGDAFVNLDGMTGRVWYNENLGKPTNYAGPWGEGSHVVSRVGKTAAGRVLDGRTWDEFPPVGGMVASE